MKKKSIYKNPAAKAEVLGLYDEKFNSLDFPIQEIDIETSFGKTRVLTTGNPAGKKVVLFHGIHAGAPLTLESVQGLQSDYHLIAIDTIGQATKSAETTINIKDDSFAKWADETLEGLAIQKADFIGISYGAYILQKLMKHKSERINKAIFVVPSGLANGNAWPSLTKLTIPLIRFHISKTDKALRKFIAPFVPRDDEYMFRFQKAILLGVHMDYRRPSILQAQDVKHFTQPVYMIAADDDVFFPADKTIKKAKQVFRNLAEIHLLKNCKHMPSPTHLVEIEEKISSWIG